MDTKTLTDADWREIEDGVTTDEAGNVITTRSHLARFAPRERVDALYAIIKENVTDGFEDEDWTVDWPRIRREYEALV